MRTWPAADGGRCRVLCTGWGLRPGIAAVHQGRDGIPSGPSGPPQSARGPATRPARLATPARMARELGWDRMELIALGHEPRGAARPGLDPGPRPGPVVEADGSRLLAPIQSPVGSGRPMAARRALPL